MSNPEQENKSPVNLALQKMKVKTKETKTITIMGDVEITIWHKSINWFMMTGIVDSKFFKAIMDERNEIFEKIKDNDGKPTDELLEAQDEIQKKVMPVAKKVAIASTKGLDPEKYIVFTEEDTPTTMCVNDLDPDDLVKIMNFALYNMTPAEQKESEDIDNFPASERESGDAHPVLQDVGETSL